MPLYIIIFPETDAGAQAYLKENVNRSLIYANITSYDG
jgi:hypothetical protein